VIKNKDFNILNGGVLSASLRMLDPWITYSSNSTISKKEAYSYTQEDFIALYQPSGEILFMLKPSSTLEVEISVDESTYAPGDEVAYSISVSESGKAVQDGFLSVTVSDGSVNAQVSEKQLPPSLAAMIMLE